MRNKSHSIIAYIKLDSHAEDMATLIAGHLYVYVCLHAYVHIYPFYYVYGFMSQS